MLFYGFHRVFLEGGGHGICVLRLEKDKVAILPSGFVGGKVDTVLPGNLELGKRNDVREHAKRLRRQFLRYKDAEIVYSIHHKKLLEMANKAGAIYRIDGTVLINRDIFDQYLEQFHEPSTLTQAEEKQ